MRRIFVVGCPRSGTTLLQSFLAAHPQVHSFPETHFFHRLQAPRGGRRAAGLAATGAAGRLDEAAGRLGAPRRRPVLPTVRRSGAAFVAMADAAARRNGADTWVEKTPANLYVLDLIERVVPGAQVVHIVRRRRRRRRRRDGHRARRRAGGLVEDFEHWKADNTGPLRDGAGRRAREVFDAATLRYVRERVAAVPVRELAQGT
ncbi:sulfotransferase [Blastococcus sp. BMG 814]|uniref:Sulfotransferase n=1 Tax=Blastococcus carthaginiensis TaxID=3050034 RepID=A0ABT9I7S3_9ACTN|nr:sulfotransferase [Blastococcus carthaginiensis]MDP5181620.1 sulfotransferase [Blastococcus carthaginiensis]